MSDVHDTSPVETSALVEPVGPEPEVSGPVIDLADRPALMSFLRDVVLQTDGVWRLEPTIVGTLASIGTSVAGARTDGASALSPRRFDGITVLRTGSSLDVNVDLATLWDFPAIDVARVVQGRIHDALVEAGLTPGVIDVSVLAIGSDEGDSD